MAQAIADRLGKARLLQFFCQALEQPDLECGEERLCLRLSNGSALGGGQAADPLFDRIHGLNLAQRLFGAGRAAGLVDLPELAAGMGEAEGERDRPTRSIRLGQPAIAGIGIDLEHAAEAGEMLVHGKHPPRVARMLRGCEWAGGYHGGWVRRPGRGRVVWPPASNSRGGVRAGGFAISMRCAKRHRRARQTGQCR